MYAIRSYYVDPYTVDICLGYQVTYRWLAEDVITSYSIHYTKLYERTVTFNVLPDTQAPTFDSEPAAIGDIACSATLPVQETLTASDDCSEVTVTASVDPYTVDICLGYP